VTAVADGPTDGSGSPADNRAESAVPRPGPWSWIGLALGGAIMAYAVWGAVQAFSTTEQLGLARWLVGSAIAHDFVLAPVVTVIGLVLARFLPVSVRGPVLGATAISGIVLLVSWPALRGYGLRAGNPSILPHDYPRNAAIVLGLVWAVALVVVAVRLIRVRRR